MHQVTVLMPCYNAMPYLPEAVESIRAQTERRWRMVIVDDGSTDGTAAYLEGLDDPRIKRFRRPNSGPAAAANFGLEQIETPLTMRIDADDVALPTRMAEQVEFLQRHPRVGLVGSQIRMLGARRQGPVSTLPTDHHSIVDDLLRGRHAMCNPAVMCRTDLLREIGGYDTQSDLEDWDMFLRMAEMAELANVDQPLLLYRVHAASLNGRKIERLRSSVAFACEQAHRRRNGGQPIGYEEFLAQRRAAPVLHRALEAMDDVALLQYRNAMAEILGDGPIRGRLRLGLAAAASPRLTARRINRTFRKRIAETPDKAPPTPEATMKREPVATTKLPSSLERGSAEPRAALSKLEPGNEGTSKPRLLGPRTDPATQSQEDCLAGTCNVCTLSAIEPDAESHPADNTAAKANGSAAPLVWPRKYDLFGVGLSATTYDEVAALIVEAARRRQAAVASFHAVHAVVTASADESLRRQVNTFEIVAPDGQPVRWALNWLYRTALADRVYGPEMMLRLCRYAAEAGIPVFLCGGSPEVAAALPERLTERFPGLIIAGSHAPPFRPLSPEEDRQLVEQINASGAGIVFIGLGCPKQDRFAYDHRDRIGAVQVCVGAAFDLHAGTKQMAPDWMQRRGLEWLFRLSQEPGRLWKRYLLTNTIFVAKLLAACFQRRRAGGRPASAT